MPPRRIPESRTAKVASEIGTSPASGTDRGARTQVTAAQSAQRTRSCVDIFIVLTSQSIFTQVGSLPPLQAVRFWPLISKTLKERKTQEVKSPEEPKTHRISKLNR